MVRDLKDNLPEEILRNIQAGAIDNDGVHGLADSLHISERHLRRVVQDKTGVSPSQFNQAKRLTLAQQLVVRSDMPIIDVAFQAGFSSLRQFNDTFKSTFGTTPRAMRKAFAKKTRSKTGSIALLLRVVFLQVPLRLKSQGKT